MAAFLATTTYAGLNPLGSLATGLITEIGGERANGGFSNANYLGFFAAQASLLAIGSWSLAKPFLRPFLVALAVLLVVTVTLTFSRGAYIGTAAGIIVLITIRSRKAGIVLMLATIAIAAVVYPAFLEARLGAEVLDPNATAARLQSEHWRGLASAAGLAMFAAQPVFGIGFGVFHFVSPAFIGASPATYSHDQYVNVLAEQGLLGALMIAGMVACLAYGLLRSTHPLRGATFAMLIAYLIQSAFINSTTSFQISGLTWLAMAAALGASRPSGPIREES